ncbi:MAG TPA: DoxX family protein [Vicinamibacterales bacterium]
MAKYATMRPYGPAALRLCVGAVFLAHGVQKLFGVWDGTGLGGTAALITSFGLTPAYPLAVLAAVAEFGGGALLVLGGLTRWVALALMVEVGVAVWKVNYLNGFFLTSHGGPGIEYRLVVIGALLCLMLTGPGAFSVDEWRNSSAEAMRAGRARARKV